MRTNSSKIAIICMFSVIFSRAWVVL